MSSTRRAFIAIDAGTGGGKCAVFDASGRRLAVHRQPWTYRVTPNPDMPFIRQFDFDPEEFWGILCRCIRSCCEQAGLGRKDLAGIATTSQREGCVFLGDEGKEIYAGPNLDARGFAEGLEVLNELGADRLYDVTGHSAPFIFPLVRYLWHRKHRDQRVRRILMINDWMVFRLSGAIASEPSNGTESMLLDLKARDWSAEILEKFDIPRDILPPVVQSGSRVGTLTPKAAQETGLPEGLPVFVGGADTQCSLLGAGVTEVGAAAATLGTTTPIQLVRDQPTFDPARNLWAGCHVIPDRWVLESNAGDTGDAYIWLLQMLGGSREPVELFRLGEELAREVSSPEVYTFIGPSIFNIAEMRPNKPGGILFPFPALHMRPTRADLIRSYLDSIGFAIRANCEQIEAVIGSAATSLTLSGGLTRSRALAQRIANISARPVKVANEPESAALGCAVLVATGTGTFPRIEAAAEAMVHVTEMPANASTREQYEKLYAKWRQLNGQLDTVDL